MVFLYRFLKKLACGANFFLSFPYCSSNSKKKLDIYFKNYQFSCIFLAKFFAEIFSKFIKIYIKKYRFSQISSYRLSPIIVFFALIVIVKNIVSFFSISYYRFIVIVFWNLIFSSPAVDPIKRKGVEEFRSFSPARNFWKFFSIKSA